jgi:hypothetical protein
MTRAWKIDSFTYSALHGNSPDQPLGTMKMKRNVVELLLKDEFV